jgi:hypothetical protein
MKNQVAFAPNRPAPIAPASAVYHPLPSVLLPLIDTAALARCPRHHTTSPTVSMVSSHPTNHSHVLATSPFSLTTLLQVLEITNLNHPLRALGALRDSNKAAVTNPNPHPPCIPRHLRFNDPSLPPRSRLNPAFQSQVLDFTHFTPSFMKNHLAFPANRPFPIAAVCSISTVSSHPTTHSHLLATSHFSRLAFARASGISLLPAPEPLP